MKQSKFEDFRTHFVRILFTVNIKFCKRNCRMSKNKVCNIIQMLIELQWFSFGTKILIYSVSFQVLRRIKSKIQFKFLK